MMNRFKLQASALACLFVFSAALFAAPETTRQAVRTQEDLPRHSYPVSGTAVELLNADDATFNAWAEKVNTDVDATLSGYDIQDHATLRQLLRVRLAYQVLTHQDEAGLSTIAQLRAVEDKPDAKLVSAMRTEAILRARIVTGERSGAKYEEAYATGLAAALAATPWGVGGTRIKEDRTFVELLTEPLLVGLIKADVEPTVALEHAISDGPASSLLTARMRIKAELPVREQSITAFANVIAANNTTRPDIWAAREVTLTAGDRTTPVVAAVWDSGTDLSLFPNQTYTAPDPDLVPPYNVHGLAFDLDSNPASGWLYPLTAEQQIEYRARVGDFQGMNDLQQSIESAEADAIKAKFAAMPSDQVPAYFEQMSLYSGYLHGTHVAGIMARGNPAIRLAVSRITFDHRNVPAPPTEAGVMRTAQSYQTSIDWFREHQVRVVNMSWAVSPSDYELVLEKNGIGKDAADRKALARGYFETDRKGLLTALESAPDILFVCAAGNSNSDNGFDETVPSSFTLPHLLTVSAVDQAGEEASFTTYGKNVAVSGNGYQVSSTIPGGGTLNSSGTSMASPNVANLAAKLIALDPTLSPVETIRLIKTGATPSADGRRNNIDPKASVRLLGQGSKKN